MRFFFCQVVFCAELVGVCMQQMVVRRVNQETLTMFGAGSQEELLANLHNIFRAEMQPHFRAELLSLWAGERSWAGEGVNHTLAGDALDILLHWRILPGAEESCISPEQLAIIQWYKTVKFRKTLLGGVDEAAMWKKLEELYALYEAAIRAERTRYNVLLEQQTGSLPLDTTKVDSSDPQKEAHSDAPAGQ